MSTSTRLSSLHRKTPNFFRYQTKKPSRLSVRKVMTIVIAFHHFS
ncbi:hypothetical protein BTN49_1306 [Candidatus Enterovibrio escicola]|uniref:Uncharacterized protein n=1 Tax=Candidatus Enterovibrio escicola TaxID=1927127 RepID=A0A2A5T552_9GAMM|nr:hypothetical protein [Candidatus Enterovibrio escacola]PCS23309.1 hypothetical protein BTN49_1306 [Candidatus Enterovibrio escacola]